MCGIVGYIGNKVACPILIAGLKNLEYRGYDSAGLSTIEKNSLSILKNQGRVKNLSSLCEINSLNGTIGIAHTRWATHGKPSKVNSHPHLDNSKTFSVVHNGIIENYSELKEFLIQKGYTFYSETDTEVIPNLIHYYYSNTKNKNNQISFLSAIKNACNDLIGSYAIEVISKDFTNCIIVAKKSSPLVIGKGVQENYIASDIPAVLEFTKNFYFLEDNEFAVIYKNNIEFYNSNLSKIQKDLKEINWDATSADKNGFEDYMLKEIYEQPDSIRKTINSRLDENGNYNFQDLNFSKEYLKSLNKIYIVACGTAMHAGLAVKNTLEKLCNVVTQVEVASEFRYRNPLIDSNTLCIFISQSGETADTLAALELCKLKGAKTIAITNVIGSSITRCADFSIFTQAGPEIAVASTKAYTSQVTLLTMLAIYIAETMATNNSNFIKDLKVDILSLPDKIQACLTCSNNIKDFSNKIFEEKDIFFLGRGVDYTTAIEASLKLKEISYIHSEAYPAGELKHGPIALIENRTTVVSILTDSNLVPKSISNTQEVITRGAKTLIITNQDLPNNNFDTIINIPKINEFISPVLAIIPLQLLAYYISKNKNLDVDKPRNLAKSVTVE
jgi:glucosamine--fructose-6-phosphate aminotransferase (isomerizing)